MAADPTTLPAAPVAGTGLRCAATRIVSPGFDGTGLSRIRVTRRLLGVADLVAGVMALLVVIPLSGTADAEPVALLLLPALVVAASALRLYDRDEILVRKSTLDEAPRVLQLATLAALLLWPLEEQFFSAPLQTTQIVAVPLVIMVLTLAGRVAARWVARWASPAERCLFVGDAGAYQRLAAKFDGGSTDATLVGYVRPPVASAASGAADVNRAVQEAEAERLVIEPDGLPPDEMQDVLRTAMATGVRVSLLPRELDVLGPSVVVDNVDGVTLLSVRPTGLSRSSRSLKRCFDLVGAVIALAAVAPLVVLAAVMIKLDSRGPLLFSQVRVGRDGCHFKMWKFRTMCPDAEARKEALRAHNEVSDGLFKIAEDPRVTRVGRLLRRSSLDELPQLLNVLRGDMSLVGPRPLVTDEDAQITGFARSRLQLTPGMTGPWQILGSARVPLEEMVKLDYLYLAGWSLWADTRILLRTVPYVLARRSM